MAAIVTGLAWYRRPEWPLLRSFSVDADDLESTYDEWLATAERCYRQLQAQGSAVERVDVPIGELFAWCTRQQRPLDETARAEFVAVKLREKDGTPG